MWTSVSPWVASALRDHTRNERAQRSTLDHDLRDALFADATEQLPRMSARDLRYIAFAADGISDGQYVAGAYTRPLFSSM